jgi:glycerol uptake facilitator-like aquaporin
MSFSLGDISGGHLNPAVTWSLFVTGYISLYRLFVYVLCQCLGGIIAALILARMLPYCSAAVV